MVKEKKRFIFNLVLCIIGTGLLTFITVSLLTTLF